ncbi:helix-turn-helix domain-containing protein [Phytoactinopolyspora mesophila]|uniref:helix-turn-helix domain-containing protein n=1 Tax=Phytoactinopolyspora mesophila TaxID=2650750 RepID=UPI001C9E8D7E
MPRQSALEIGSRLRAERQRVGISARALAREIGVSPSLVSQIETGKSRPSVSTLYAITNTLGISIEDLFDRPERALGSEGADPAGVSVETGLPDVLAALAGQHGGPAVSSGQRVLGPDREREVGPVVQPGEREILTLDSGVTWERLGQVPGAHIDFLRITYQPGSTSAGNGRLMRHSGVEYGYVVSGELVLTLGFDEYQLGPGDAVSFSSSIPHGYRNDGIEPAVGIWFVLEST